jgi:hypothetical protein
MCYIDGQNNKYSVLNECNRMLKYNIFNSLVIPIGQEIMTASTTVQLYPKWHILSPPSPHSLQFQLRFLSSSACTNMSVRRILTARWIGVTALEGAGRQVEGSVCISWYDFHSLVDRVGGAVGKAVDC